MKKRLLAIILCLVITAGIVSACSRNDPLDNGDPGVTEKPVELITLRAFKDSPPNPDGWAWGDDYVTKWIEETYGIRLEVEYAMDDQSTQLSTMLASGIDLPDFMIVDMNSPLRRILVDQGFAAPLNQWADEYYPHFWDVLPTDMDAFFREDDENFYFVTDFFGNVNKLGLSDLIRGTDRGIAVNQRMLAELGNPDISTWEAFSDTLELARNTFPDISFILFDQFALNSDETGSFINHIARFFGASNSYYQVNDDGSITFLPLSDVYKTALEQYNKLYRRGLINPEMFTFRPWSEVQADNLMQENYFAFNGAYWMVVYGHGFPNEVISSLIPYPIPEGSTLTNFIRDNRFGLGINSTFISASTEYPKEVMQYLSYLLSDLGQIQWRFGLEGVSFEYNADGSPEWKDIVNDLEDSQDAGRIFGINNYNYGWVPQNWIFDFGARSLYSQYAGQIEAFELTSNYIRKELLADLVWSVSGEEALLIRERIINLWQTAVPQIVTSNNEAAFEASYESFINDLERLGVADLERFMTVNRNQWIAKGVIPDS